MSTAETIMPTLSRSPNGCSRQVMTQLTDDERQQLESLAKREGRSMSATLRLFYLRGIAASGGGHPVNA